jgi:exopolysaccharide biosynthesis polyprenyl glycosylphosphotransferase
LSSVENKKPAQPGNNVEGKTGDTGQTTRSNSLLSGKNGLEKERAVSGHAADSGPVLPADPLEPAQTKISKPPVFFENNAAKTSRESSWYTLRLILDVSLITLAFALAYLARYTLQIGSEVLEEYQVSLAEYFPVQLAYMLILLVTLHFRGFYRRTRSPSILDDLGHISSATLVAFAGMIVLVFITRPIAFSRLMFVYLVPLTIVMLLIQRIVLRRIRRYLLHRGIGVSNLLVVGATDAASRLMNSVVSNPHLGYRLKGFVDDQIRFSEWILPTQYPDGSEVPYIGTINELNDLIYRHQVNEVIIALPSNYHATINEIINRCRESGVGFSLVPDLFEMRLDLLNFSEINGVPLLGLKNNSLRGWNYVVKRTMDIYLALAALLITIPLTLLIALAIKIDSRGPIIYRQTRIGKHGKPFTFYKFRSMRVGSDKQLQALQVLNETGGVTFKMKNDPRRTRVGKFLRRTSLDELPQLINILLGQMSFVGPRPPIDREVEKYQEWHYRRLEVACGLTGLWQVSGRSKLTFDDMVKLDIYYAENWSLWLDIKILIRTIPAVLKGEGAY